MPRHLDLGDDGDEAGLGIRDDLPGIVLRIEPAVTLAVELRVPARTADQRFLPPSANLGQPRILLDLEPPALVLGKVPVEDVELVEGQEVDVLLHELLRHEVARDIEMAASPSEPRTIFDGDGRDLPANTGDRRFPQDFRWQELPQRLHGVEQPGLPRCASDDAGGLHVQQVSFVAEPLQ